MSEFRYQDFLFNFIFDNAGIEISRLYFRAAEQLRHT